MILYNTTLWLLSIAAAMTIAYEAIKIFFIFHDKDRNP